MNKTAVLLNTRNRATECCLALQSLRTQTLQDFDVFILEDSSEVPLNNFHFFHCLINRLRLEGHKVFYQQTLFPHGVSKARQAIVDWALSEGDYEYFCRLDDDCVFEPEYMDKLMRVIDQGYDLASGVTVPMTGPTFKRDPDHVGDVINRVVLDKEGNYIFNGDDCGMEYIKSKILPAHHFRSCALYTTEIHKKGVNYTPTRLSKHGFREEQIFSYKILMAGFKIGVDTEAVNYHQMTPSGGERFNDSNELIKFNQEELERWTKEHKEELNKIFGQQKLSKQDIMKETNLARLK